jgi:putative ABC transport system permease protein
MGLPAGLVGHVLGWIFAQSSPLWTLLAAFIMIAVAGHEIRARQSRRFRGATTYLLGSGTLLFVGTLSTLYAVMVIIGPEPWYHPRYILPILGMILGNAMTGIALTLNTLTESASRDRTIIEARLAAGQDRYTAMGDTLRQALRTGMMPIVNALAVTGIVSLPGMMTGQILAGLDPVQAASYQVMIMFSIASATALGIVIAGYAAVILLTDDRHRLRLDRLEAQA